MTTFSGSRVKEIEAEVTNYLWRNLEAPKKIVVIIDYDDDYLKSIQVQTKTLGFFMNLSGWSIRIPPKANAASIITLADFQGFLTDHDRLARMNPLVPLSLPSKEEIPGTRVNTDWLLPKPPKPRTIGTIQKLAEVVKHRRLIRD